MGGGGGGGGGGKCGHEGGEVNRNIAGVGFVVQLLYSIIRLQGTSVMQPHVLRVRCYSFTKTLILRMKRS